MSTNITASSNTRQTVPIHEEEHNVSEDVTDGNDVTASTAMPMTEDKASMIDEYCPWEDVTQDAQRYCKNFASKAHITVSNTVSKIFLLTE
jgi:hypothetical protein